MKEFYGAADAPPLKQAGKAGAFPFTRGIYPEMYQKRLWTMRQYSGFGSAKETNKRFRFLLERGQTGLSCAFDLPTQIGYDPDHRMARGEVGRVGVSLATLDDMAELMAGIPLDKISLSMTINATAATLLGFYVTLARKRRVPLKKLAGTVQNDILKEYVARGTYLYPPAPSMRLCADLMEYCIAELPRFHPISVSGYHMREAGATAVQEIAFTMAHALAYAEGLIKRSIPFDAFGPSFSFFFNVHNDFFEEIAKFRAARTVWAKLAKKRLGARKAESMKLRFHAQTAGSTLTYQRPKNNLTRVTYQALAAVLGGAQSLHTNAWDEALGLPSEESAKTALRIQQIVAYESGVPAAVDPLGGSYYVESLTRQIEERVMKLIGEIDAMGGALQALEQRFQQNEIRKSAFAAQKALEHKESLVVGLNIFQDNAQKIPGGLTVKPVREREQKRRIATYRRGRAQRHWNKAMDGLKETAAGKGNIMEPLLKAIDAKATLGEIADALREIFGEHRIS